jgi:hypothetical protein
MAAPPKPPNKPKPAEPTNGSAGLRIIINGVEGVGKTTLAAYSQNPVIVMAPNETGVTTLYDFGLIPDVGTVKVNDWTDLLAKIDRLESSDHATIAIDALGGFERLCHEHVCVHEFKGDWGEKGFLAYHKGYEIALSEWLKLLQRLDKLRMAGKNVLLLSHVKVKNFRNPLGSDFDRYVADCHEKTWGITHKWADCVLFYTFFTVVKNDKGVGGTTRVMYANRTDAYDAKNRFGLPDVIDVPDDREQAWNTIWNLIQERRIAR